MCQYTSFWHACGHGTGCVPWKYPNWLIFARTGALELVEQMNYQWSGTVPKPRWWADLPFGKVALSHSTQRSLRPAPHLQTQ